MSKALIPGSFDPITLGHLDIIKRAARLFDEVVVLISKNPEKNYMLCSEKRALLCENAVKDLKNVSVVMYDGLLVDFAIHADIDVTVKGIRNSTDYEYESSMASANMLLSKQVYGKPFETLLMPCSNEYRDISSTAVRILLRRGADISNLVPNADLLYKTSEQ